MDLLIRNRVPRTIQWLMNVFWIYLILFTCFRLATIIAFKPANTGYLELLPACWLGLKYDLRWIAFILMPIALLSVSPKLSPYYSYRNIKMWTLYLGLVTLFVLFFYGADFGQFAYINARLNADALVFMEDPKEHLLVVWHSYPVVWILFALLGAVGMMTWMFRRVHVGVLDKNSAVHKFDYKRRYHLIALLLLGWFIYGFLTAEPLSVFRAFNLNNEFKTNLALNPLQNFFTSLRFTRPDPLTNARPHYARMAQFLNIHNTISKTHPYARVQQPGSSSLETQPNVVLVVCESFSMYKSSMSGNVLDASPRFNKLSEEGVFFERCFAPSFGTARGMFALLTGVPDVQSRKFSTRNPETAHQRSLLESLEGYNTFYLTGGKAQFNNYEGLVKNIPGIQIVDETRWRAPRQTVWGLSDLDLLLEADSLLALQQKPFFAIIHTSNNQRPYQLPAAAQSIQFPQYPIETLRQNGFESEDEFRSFVYADYCYDQFIRSARQQAYFKNTVFVFVGDHGLEGDASAVYSKVWTDQRLSEVHVPLLFYAPALLKPEKRKETVSQIDVLPSIASLMQQPFTNTALGRDLFNNHPREHAAFIMYHGGGWIGVVNDDFYYRKNIKGLNEELVPISGKPATDSIKKHLSELTEAIYQTSRWLLLHNKPG